MHGPQPSFDFLVRTTCAPARSRIRLSRSETSQLNVASAYPDRVAVPPESQGFQSVPASTSLEIFSG